MQSIYRLPHGLLLSRLNCESKQSSQLLTALQASIEDQVSFPLGSRVPWWGDRQLVDVAHQCILPTGLTTWRIHRNQWVCQPLMQSNFWLNVFLRFRPPFLKPETKGVLVLLFSQFIYLLGQIGSIFRTGLYYDTATLTKINL